jgi:predicted lipid-binding transport protein (Tim44 family)
VKRLLLSLAVVLCSVGFVASDVEAKRLGGGSSSGMKRQTPPPQSPAQNATPNQAAPATAAAPTAAAGAQAAAPKRSWMGPIAGLAAGLGIAALLSHFGMGEGLANVMTMLLIAAAAFFVIRFLLRRFGPGAAKGAAAGPNGMRFATAGDAPATPPQQPGWASGPAAAPGSALAGGSSASSAAPAGMAAAGRIPADFDTAGFERVAKLIFIRLQAANDAGDLNDLRQFATPEMFATFKLDLQERGAAKQQTDVVQLEAEVVDVESTAEQQVVSVRFHGLIREEQDSGATHFDEVWHLVKPADGSREWAIAGIAQNAAA